MTPFGFLMFAAGVLLLALGSIYVRFKLKVSFDTEGGALGMVPVLDGALFGPAIICAGIAFLAKGADWNGLPVWGYGGSYLVLVALVGWQLSRAARKGELAHRFEVPAGGAGILDAKQRSAKTSGSESTSSDPTKPIPRRLPPPGMIDVNGEAIRQCLRDRLWDIDRLSQRARAINSAVTRSVIEKALAGGYLERESFKAISESLKEPPVFLLANAPPVELLPKRKSTTNRSIYRIKLKATRIQFGKFMRERSTWIGVLDAALKGKGILTTPRYLRVSFGSIRIDVDIDARDARRLEKAYLEGELKFFGIMEVSPPLLTRIPWLPASSILLGATSIMGWFLNWSPILTVAGMILGLAIGAIAQLTIRRGEKNV